VLISQPPLLVHGFLGQNGAPLGLSFFFFGFEHHHISNFYGTLKSF
jgi:hypothetical protein